MLHKNNLDLKIILSFTNAYEDLYQKGEITSSQRDRILSLLDNYQKYSPEKFKEEIKEIF